MKRGDRVVYIGPGHEFTGVVVAVPNLVPTFFEVRNGIRPHLTIRRDDTDSIVQVSVGGVRLTAGQQLINSARRTSDDAG